MSFYRRYQLERLVAEGEAKTFRAVEIATGRTVLVHIFDAAGRELVAVLKARAVGPDGKPLPPVLEIGEFAGSPYAVTEASDPFPGLRRWIELLPGAVPAAEVPPVEAPPPRPPTPSAAPVLSPLVEDDAFSRLFGSSEAPPPNPPALLDDAAGELIQRPEISSGLPAPHAAAKLPALVADEDGEFTRLFGSDDAFPKVAPSAPSGAVPPSLLDDASGEFRLAFPSPPPSAPPAPPAPEQLGDFTRAFGPAAPQAPESVKPRARVPPPTPRRPSLDMPPSPPSDWAVADTGQFTKLFGSGLAGEALDIAGEQAKAAQSAPSEGRPFQQAGEFTRIFGPPAGGNASPAEPAAAPVSLNTSPSGLFAIPGNAAKPAPPEIPGQDSAPVPGEYNSVFGERPTPSQPAAPPAVRKPAPDIELTAPRSRMRPAVIAGVAVLLVILIVVVVMLARR